MKESPSGLGLPLPIQIFVVYQMTGISQAVAKFQKRKTQASP